MSRIQEVDSTGPWQHVLNQQYAKAINDLLLQWQPLSPAQLTGNQNNYDVGETKVARLSSDASRNITGFANGENAIILLVINVGAQNIVIMNQNASSAEANRVITNTGADVTLAANDSMLLWYDSVTARWRQLF